jgi:hypothetical protein
VPVRRPILLVLLAGLPLALVLAAQPRPAPAGASERVANYTIRVRLDAAAKMLAGSQVLEWTNDTPATAFELWFHLYWNAWRNDRSTWLRGDALRRPPRGHAPGRCRRALRRGHSGYRTRAAAQTQRGAHRR